MRIRGSGPPTSRVGCRGCCPCRPSKTHRPAARRTAARRTSNTGRSVHCSRVDLWDASPLFSSTKFLHQERAFCRFRVYGFVCVYVCSHFQRKNSFLPKIKISKTSQNERKNSTAPWGPKEKFSSVKTSRKEASERPAYLQLDILNPGDVFVSTKSDAPLSGCCKCIAACGDVLRPFL